MRTRTRANTVVAIDVVDVIGPRIFVHPRVLERRSVVDPVAIDVNRENAQIGCERIYRPRNCNNLAATANNTCSCAASGNNGIRHTAVATVDYDVFTYADFLTLGRFNFPAD